MTTQVAEPIPATLAGHVHMKTLDSPKPIASNAKRLDDAALETVETKNAKTGLIASIQSGLAKVRSYRLGLGPLQAVVVGYLAELLLLKPTNKELAEAMAEQYNANVHGDMPLVVTQHSPEFVNFGANREPANPEFESIVKLKKDGTPSTPNPYAQSVRRYKILAQIEAKIAGNDENGNPWDFSTVADGVKINSVLYASPVAALMSGVVSMEAVFVAWTNLLQPKLVDMRSWSTGHMTEAKKCAASVQVRVREFNKKMNREALINVVAVKSASCLFGLILGLLEHEDEKNPIRLGRARADQIIAAVNAKVDVDADPS